MYHVVARAKAWLKAKARGSERYGILVSSQAERLRPYAIDVRPEVDPIHWFLGGKDDVRSSYYLEDVATEFHCQGLEIDWACVTWDADFRFNGRGWDQYSFRASRWQRINKADRMRLMLAQFAKMLMLVYCGCAAATDGHLTALTRHYFRCNLR